MEAISKYFALFMCLVYIMIGSAMLADSPLFSHIQRSYTLVIGALMIVYGIFRGYRVYQKYFVR